MIVDLPSTTTVAISKKLVALRQDTGAMALGRVLTLLIVVDEQDAEEAIEAANDASRQHPCRIIAVVIGNKRGQSRIDAQIRVGGDAGASEVVVLRLYGALTEHGRSVVIPLLLPDSPVVAWWPTRCPRTPCRRPDRLDGPAPHHRRRRGQEPSRRRSRPGRGTYTRGDTDLAWTRVTLWRGLLAAALDQPPFEPVTEATVTGGSDSPSTDLLAGLARPDAAVPRATGPLARRHRHGQRPARASQRRHRPGPTRRLDRHAEPARPAGAPDLAGPQGDRGVPRRRAAPARSRRDLRGDHPQGTGPGRHQVGHRQ